ncbi:DNA replication/repair protein RecF [bacterium]|nr:MAG: DNA replication/repair protein RecF [bacterium]
MVLTRLELTNFRSYTAAIFDLHPEVTLVVGPNATGKTNLLEGLYVLAATKSFRARDRDVVHHEADFYRIVARGEMEMALAVSMAAGVSKKVTHDGVKRTLAAHIGRLQVTLFEPAELTMLQGPPDGRRRYLDFVLCQTDRSYLLALMQYRRVLKQRNALLDSKQWSVPPRDQLFAWNVKLAELAVDIWKKRSRFLEVINKQLPQLYQEIAGEPVPVSLEYQPSVTGDYAANFLDELERCLDRDFAAGFTTIGPHREDFGAKFKTGQVVNVASRGEVRTVVLALKLAELEYAQAQTGVRPLLLLDDVFSELDKQRRAYLLDRLGGYQTVITTTDADAVTKEFRTDHSTIWTGEV